MDTKHDDVTIIMPTFNNLDFTKASTFSIRQFYPDIRIIYADGGSSWETYSWFSENKTCKDFVACPRHFCYEDVLNTAAALVDTPYLLIINNTVKLEYPGRQIEIMKETLSQSTLCAQTGAYCIKVTNWKKRKAFVSTIFNKSMEVTACSGHLTMHRTGAFKLVDGQPKKHFYKTIPKKFTHWSSDLAISNEYRKYGYKIYCPSEPVPHLHWAQASLNYKPNEFREWWYKNTNHIRQEPLK